ncbi:general transcription factor IIE subunit 2 isoform X2 [Daktulosphaira vitifoliae]|uniref:general transcription factor IIE subunit 2 isoform X1 n=1 Tax=Daktulosphaira vitifoliae TaxID=58002 RepID=UPI0021AA05C1|nr:general transcription factor IIE subunit 2 isoform X1 [Daktulosphaira vitifoliae]XP_050529631.1 general transcription factor IIE subunit 2 isoform X2 [Daktulosphaira vitifoliae]
MDPALLREREIFKLKASAIPVVEKRQKDDSSKDEFKKKSKPLPPMPRPPSPPNTSNSVNYKSFGQSSQYKFGVLTKIVKYIKASHQNGDDHPLTLDELLDETNQLDVGAKVKIWLESEALPSNPKIERTQDGKYMFKPPYKLKDRKALLKLLKQQDLKGLGGIMLDDIQESLPNCEKALKHLQNEILYVSRPGDKKKVIFYNDKSATIEINEEFKKMWRSVAVENMDDDKIEEHLEKQGISSMQDNGIKKINHIKRKKPITKKRIYKKPRDNEHLANVLEDYDTL